MTKRLAAGLAALLLAVPVTLSLWGFLLPVQYGDTFMGELPVKVRLLDQAQGRRVILLGGSSVAFGVDSAAMEQVLDGYTVVNFGLYAALGTRVMMELSRGALREGDLVVLLPEIQEQTLSDFVAPEILWQGVEGDAGLLGRVSLRTLKALCGAFPPYAAQKAGLFLRGEHPEGEGVYARASFNEKGDIETALCAGNVMPSGYDALMPVRMAPDVLSDAFAESVREYAGYAASRGARTMFAFCPVNEKAVEGDPDAFGAYLQERLGIPVIGQPRDSVLHPGWFYDTNFHLNQSGRARYTRVLLEAVLAFLGDATPLDLPFPAMPEAEEAELFRGDDSDAALFVFAQEGEGWRVTGLDGGAASRQVLTVPTFYRGKPVLSIGEGAFSSAVHAREIIIQGNILRIADGAFDGCRQLERVRLRLESPSGCRVGQGLLRGTPADLSVPAGMLTRFRTDYFWSVYGVRLRGEEG